MLTLQPSLHVNENKAMNDRLRPMLLAMSAVLLCASATYAAESYPSRPVRLVVAYAAGGGNDVTARILAARLSETLGTNVIVIFPGSRDRQF